MDKTNGNKLRKTMRALHRDLGFVALAMILIYVVSGILLTYRTTDFLKYDQTIEKTLPSGLNEGGLKKELKLRQFQLVRQTDREIQFTQGVYCKESGNVTYQSKEYYFPLNKFVKLHKAHNGVGGVHWFTVSFGVILGFLALSAFWMYKPATRLFNRGLILTVLGVIISVALLVVL